MLLEEVLDFCGQKELCVAFVILAKMSVLYSFLYRWLVPYYGCR